MISSHQTLRKFGNAFLLLAVLAPLVGLAGTVWGMIRAFDQIAASGQTPKPSVLANGISTSLLATMIGLSFAAVFAVLGIGLLIKAAAAEKRQKGTKDLRGT